MILAFGKKFGSKLVERVRELKQPHPITRSGGALCNGQTFRSKSTVIFGARHSTPSEVTSDGVQYRFPKYLLRSHKFSTEQVPDWGVTGSDKGNAEECSMQDAKTYRQYAVDCRRIAATMNGSDKATLLEMAKIWDERAADAESVANKGTERALD